MSSVGQAAGYVVGGVVGSFFGNPIIGAQIGGMIGGYIDPPKGQNTVGPRLQDQTIQTSTYGAVIPRVKGTIAVTGNVFWLEGDKYKEHEKKTKSGGKGGPKATNTTFSYSATFAVSLAHCITGPITGVRRIWLANRLVYDAGSDNLESILASNLNENVVFKIYDGRDDQAPDPRMQADKGVANVSGYPGRASIVFYDLDLTEHYSNALMATQATIEIVSSGTHSIARHVAFTTPDTSSMSRVISAVLDHNSIDYVTARLDAGLNFYGIETYTAQFGEYVKKTGALDHSISAAYGLTLPTLIRVMDNLDGVCASVISQGNYLYSWTYLTIIKNGAVLQSDALTSAELDYGQYQIAACDESDTFLADNQSSRVLVGLAGVEIRVKSSVSVRASAIALSETSVFVAHYAAAHGSATVSVFDRASLSLAASYTQSVEGFGDTALHVISDDEFYLASDGNLSHWVGGVATDLGNVINDSSGALGAGRFIRAFENDYIVQFDSSSAYDMQGVVNGPLLARNSAYLHDIITEECALAGVDSADLDLSDLTNHVVQGYKIATLGSARSAIEPLQAAFPFDVIQSGYKVKFKDRGSSPVLTVQESELGAHESGSSLPILLPDSIEMESQIASKVSIKYYDATRDYDIDEQVSSNRAGDSVQSRTVSLPIVFTADEALRAADVLLKKEWAERRKFGPFHLPPTDAFRKVEAADVITVIHRGRSLDIRVIKATELPTGIKECDGVLTSSAAYVSAAIAQPPLVLGQSTVPLRGSSEVVLLDIPRIDSAQAAPGIAAAMFGYTSAWPGGVLLRSDDNEQSFSQVSGFSSRAQVFTASNSIGAGRSDIVDASSVLVVAPDWVGADLYSITDDQLFAGQNMAAYGADGRWEIIGFRTVVESSGIHTLSDFLRGRFGTEHAMTTHQAGDRLVMLDSDIVQFIGLPVAALNMSRPWRAVTSGSSIDSAASVNHTYTGVNLKPLSPVYLNGARDPSSFDWTICFTPRSRTPTEPFSGFDTPDSEPPAAYELDVWDSSFATIKRTLYSSSPSFNYSNAQQIADFGSKQQVVYVDGYKASPLVGRGYPLRGSVDRLLVDDPYQADVFVLLHFDGAGATIIDEISGNLWTAYGGATQSTADPKFGSAALALDGSGDYIGMTFGAGPVGTGDFTFEWWEKPADAGNRGRFMLRNFALGGSGTSDGIAAAWNGSQWNTYGNSSSYTLGGSANSTSAYTHMAMERFGGTIRLYVAGTPLATTYTDNTDYSAHVYLYAGVYYSTAVPFNGLLDEFRGTAAARYRGNPFTPPVSPFPNP